jgi:hypothetical protein
MNFCELGDEDRQYGGDCYSRDFGFAHSIHVIYFFQEILLIFTL